MKPVTFTEIIDNLKKIDFDNTNEEKDIKKSLLHIFSHDYANTSSLDKYLKEHVDVIIKKNLEVHKHYSELTENLNKGFNISFQKNQEQIKKYSLEFETKNLNLQKDINSKKKQINKNITEAQQINLISKSDALKIYEEEIAQINFEIKEKNENCNIENSRLESEKSNKLSELTNTFDSELSILKSNNQAIHKTFLAEIESLNNELAKELKIKDEIYLRIKQTHTQTSVKLNEFINKLKAKTNSLIEQIVSKNDLAIEEINKQIELEKIKHQKNNEEILIRHSEKTKALNIVFDVQKDVYNNKTNEIININNEAVTSINQNIRQLRENIDKKIKFLEREKWQTQSKATSSEEKSKINKEYNQLVNRLKNELISLTKKNQQELNTQERIFQANLFNHDYEHVKQINEWRYSKNIYDNERKQENIKETNRFNHEIYILDTKKTMYYNILNNKQEIEKINLEKDLLPMESQIYFASALQNREINLLNLEFESYKLTNELSRNLIVNKQNIEEESYNHNFKQMENRFTYDKKSLNIEYQLQIEGNILKRNNEVEILTLNHQLQDELLKQKNNQYDEILNNILRDSNLKHEMLNQEFSYKNKLLKNIAVMEEKKRISIIQEMRIKNQLQINNAKNERSILVFKNNIEVREKYNLFFFDNVLEIYRNEKSIYDNIIKLIKIPTHPEKLRNVLTQSQDAITIFNTLTVNYLDYYFNNDFEESKKLLLSLSDSKYRLRHEEIIDSYNDNISFVTNHKNELELKKSSLQEEFTVLSNKLKQNKMLINLYRKDKKSINNPNIKNQLIVLSEENSKITQDLSNNVSITKKIDRELIPINKKLVLSSLQKEQNELNLDKEIEKDQIKYRKLVDNHQRNYTKIKKTLIDYNTSLHKQYQLLQDKPYLNDQVIELTIKKISTHYQNLMSYLILANQKLQSFWLNTFITYKNEQINIINQFTTSSELAVDQIKRTYRKFVLLETKEESNLNMNYLINEKINSDKSVKLNEESKSTLRNYINEYNELYKNTENEINSKNNKIKNDLDLITQNLNDVLINLTKKYENEVNKDNQKNTKENLRLNNNGVSIQNEIDQTTIRTNTRINLIINRYEHERKNHLKNLNSKRIRLNHLLAKLEQSITNYNENYKIDVIENGKYTKKLNKDTENDLKSFISKSKTDRNRLTRKERRALKKSYRFKVKQIKAERKKY